MTRFQPVSALSVRLAHASEAPLVWRIMRAGFEEYRLQPLVSSALSESESDAIASIQSGGAALAFLRGEPVGSVRFRVEPDALVFSRMAVIPSARHRGIGHALVGFLEEHARARGLSRVKLTARSREPDNRPYYERLGYRITGYSERYGISDLVTHMEKRI